MSADFWGPASNFGIPLAAVADTQKDPEMYVKSDSNIHNQATIFGIERRCTVCKSIG